MLWKIYKRNEERRSKNCHVNDFSKFSNDIVSHVVLDVGLFLKDYETLYEAEIPVLSEELLNSFQLDLLLVV